MLPPCQLPSAPSPSVVASKAAAARAKGVGNLFGKLAAGGIIGRAQLAEQFDQGKLFAGGAADQSAIFVAGLAECADQSGLALVEPCRSALDHQGPML
jgi:hypothetical protein